MTQLFPILLRCHASALRLITGLAVVSLIAVAGGCGMTSSPNIPIHLTPTPTPRPTQIPTPIEFCYRSVPASVTTHRRSPQAFKGFWPARPYLSERDYELFLYFSVQTFTPQTSCGNRQI